MRSATTANLAETLGFNNATPHNTSLRIIDIAGKDAEVRTLFGGGLDADQLSLGVESERADSAGEAVLGQPSTVLLKRSIGVCFAI